MMLSDRGFPVLPFDAQYNLEHCTKSAEQDDSEFDEMYKRGWVAFKSKFGWTQAKAPARLNGMDKTLGVSVFDTQQQASDAMHEGEVGECGGQYMIWGYEEDGILPKELASKILKFHADYGVFAVKYAPGGVVRFISEQPIDTYYNKKYTAELLNFAKQAGVEDYAETKIQAR